jgi:RHS repeat-associated protein
VHGGHIYNDQNQLLAEGADADNDGTPDAATDITYAYDANGNTVAVNAGPSGSQTTQKYVGHLRNRMTGFDADGDNSLNDAGDVVYTYNTADYRVSTQPVGQAAAYDLLDPQNPTGHAKPVEQSATPGGVPTLSYVLAADVVAQSDGTSVAVLIKDGHGTTRALTDSDGAILERYDADAYGNQVSYTTAAGTPLTGDPQTRWLQPDGYRDFTTGLDRNGVRDVASWMGRMLTRDPRGEVLGDTLNGNLYGYASGNPLYYTDPSGLTSNTEQLAVTSGQSALARITTESLAFVNRAVPARIVSAFATGSTAIGQTWNWLGQRVNDFATQVMGLLPMIQRTANTPIGQRLIDFELRYGEKIANVEMKYSIPAKQGASFDRLLGQINAMVTRVPVGQQPVVWTLKEPSNADLNRIYQAVGPAAFNQTQFLHGVEGLYYWMKLYFGV